MKPADWGRWFWRQLTSMRTALLLLLLLAIAAVPGSIYPQRSADPNGVALYFRDQPEFAAVLDTLQLFDVYSSSWFSAIYLLLFTSLIGCVIPRTAKHWKALQTEPPKPPAKFEAMPAHRSHRLDSQEAAKARLEAIAEQLRSERYRVVREQEGGAVSAERGYLRETGNLGFHLALLGLLVAVALGGAFSYSGQRVLTEGESFVNNLAGYDSFAPGPFFDEESLPPFSMRLDRFSVEYDLRNPANIGLPLGFEAAVTITNQDEGEPRSGLIEVNHPLELDRASIYLTGNGFAPVITVRNPDGSVAFSGPTVFLPQDGNMTSLGVIKVPDAKRGQIGILAFFYPTAEQLTTGAYASVYPDPISPLLTMNVYVGDLGLDEGIPRNVYSLETSNLTQVAGRDAAVPGLELEVGESAELPGGLGSITFDGLKRFASLDVSYNPAGLWILGFALLALFALIVQLLVPRRRVWARRSGSTLELAALARGVDPRLESLLDDLAEASEQLAKR